MDDWQTFAVEGHFKDKYAGLPRTFWHNLLSKIVEHLNRGQDEHLRPRIFIY
jgi:hypothetical protein